MNIIKKYPNDFDLGEELINVYNGEASGNLTTGLVYVLEKNQLTKLIKQYPNLTELGGKYRKLILNQNKEEI